MELNFLRMIFLWEAQIVFLLSLELDIKLLSLSIESERVKARSS